ncbi:hypothetical protein E0K89_005920 [Aquicoccus sp. SCR17]|nr:hypothetical protein [Carideicomes alvinocaridis]
MTRFALAPLCLCLALAAAPLHAQQDEEAPSEDSLGLMEEGANLFMQGLMEGVGPALEELDRMAGEMRPAIRSFVAEMGPALRDIFSKVEDWSVYEAPEMLPNGDIIIRRKEPLEDETDPIGPGEEIEL